MQLIQEFDKFQRVLDYEKLLAGLGDEDLVAAKDSLSTFKNEARFTLEMIAESLSKDMRVLEVGAGLCLLSLFLKQQGFNIVALEPIGLGFDSFDRLKARLIDLHDHVDLVVLEKTAQQLVSDDGQFDLIFSNNVVEHIDELDQAFVAMRDVLSPSGKMIHGCANYTIPYEPHFGIPILFWSVKLTKLVWRKNVEEQQDLWNSLNFISYFGVKRIARNIDCKVRFRESLTYHAFNRLRTDPEFKSRHRGTFVWKLFRFLEVSRTLKLMRLLPAVASTPMIFIVTKNAD